MATPMQQAGIAEAYRDPTRADDVAAPIPGAIEDAYQDESRGLDVAPPAGAAAARAEPTKPAPVGDNVFANSLSFFRDPERLKLAAMAAAEAQRPDLLAWIKRGYEAQQENGIDAVSALAVGDKPKAMELFNAAGDLKVTSIEEGPAKGTHTIVFADGTRRDIDAKKEVYRFLTPPQQYETQKNAELLDFKRESANTIAELRREAQNAKSAHDKAMIEQKIEQLRIAAQTANDKTTLMTAQAMLATAQAGLASARAGNVGEPKKMDDKEFNRQVSNLTEEAYTETDQGTGKKMVKEPTEALMVKALAQGAVRAEDPTISPADATREAQRRVNAIKEKAMVAADAKIAEATKGAGLSMSGYTSKESAVKAATGGLTEKDYRAKVLKDAIAAATTAPSKTGPDRGAGNAATAAGKDAAKISPASTATTVGTPASQVPQVPPAKHPEGTKLVGADGRWYTVKNGLPALDAVQPRR